MQEGAIGPSTTTRRSPWSIRVAIVIQLLQAAFVSLLAFGFAPFAGRPSLTQLLVGYGIAAFAIALSWGIARGARVAWVGALLWQVVAATVIAWGIREAGGGLEFLQRNLGLVLFALSPVVLAILGLLSPSARAHFTQEPAELPPRTG